MVAPCVVIVGLGRAGAINPDVRDADGANVQRNHLRAVLAAGMRVRGLVDPDPDARSAALTAWHDAGGSGDGADAPQLCAAPEEVEIGTADIVTIASPPAFHADHVAAAMALRPKILVIEKPLAADLSGAQTIVDLLAADAGTIDSVVNFNRRADRGMADWRKLWAGREPRSVVMRYSDGLMNYASHLVDHALEWFGVPIQVRALPPFTPSATPEANPSFVLEYDNAPPVHVLGIPDIDYDMFEIDVYFADGMVSARNNAVEKSALGRRADLYYPGYTALTAEEAGSVVRPIGGFTETYRALARRLSETDRAAEGVALCTVPEALCGMQILHAVLRSHGEAGRPIPASEYQTAAFAAP
ncbi:MAG: Gfo/Idh/MocA family oxidoreductase [Rhodospirillaceae bacterium]|jgi:predicted dehydrogenase|nr:Gfo/Idh/MocA family oxidoreductase [Rhodospirillaceae bacterium]MBT4773547.1 Gfo/Idh/MocA family oxidoreductase [Rhodospirillaceae bacterium]